MLRTQNGSQSMAHSPVVNGSKDGHWVNENTYDIPGGKVDTRDESTVQSGQGWHTQASKQTSVMQQEFAGADVVPNKGMLSVSYSYSLVSSK